MMTKLSRKRITIAVLASLVAIFVVIVATLILRTDEVLECLDRGGRWSAEKQNCECTYADRGNQSTNPTPEEIRRCSAE